MIELTDLIDKKTELEAEIQRERDFKRSIRSINGAIMGAGVFLWVLSLLTTSFWPVLFVTLLIFLPAILTPLMVKVGIESKIREKQTEIDQINVEMGKMI